MSTEGSDGDGPPSGGGGHAWERLREQRAKDLGEDLGPESVGSEPEATEPGEQDDETPDEPEQD
jgi:hypothetical protein